MRVSPFTFAMYEGIFTMALRCTPCKTEKESELFRGRKKNIFSESGNKTLGLFRAPLRCVPASQNQACWEQLRANLYPIKPRTGSPGTPSLRRKEKLFCASYGTTKVVP
jgi:hypothetical protein